MEKQRRRQEKLAARLARRQEKREHKDAVERGEVEEPGESFRDAPTALEYLEGPE